MHPYKPEISVMVTDIGNTKTSCALYKADNKLWQIRIGTDPKTVPEDLFGQIKDAIPDDISIIQHVIIASVVPELTDVWIQVLETKFHCEYLILDGKSRLGLRLPYTDPLAIGADLIANAFGAWKKYSRDLIILDLGTASTIQLVRADGFYEGVSIIPGMVTAAESLYSRTSRLKPIELSIPHKLLGTSTSEALLSGIVGSYCLMLDAFVQRIKQDHTNTDQLLTVATGGLSTMLAEAVYSIDIVDQDLTLEGLYLAYREIQGL
ncbi:MAG: type III pantothenate kinase [Candidatus Cloacimonetes bacterium HGW-Cloacimonetes-2]|jgi:type III pantothenate kinase|nr:MAG: type III pantothenate kinase [Candidatus Cloacimonetes bacterium HGW-Cloacimonetes-2]